MDSYNGLMLRHRRLLFAVCNRYAHRGLDADDLMQEVMLALWQRREKMQAIAPAPKQAAWVWRVARSTCIDLHRKREPSPTLLPDDYDAPAEDTSLHDALHELIAQLPDPDRTIVRMHLEGYEYKEISRHTGLTKNNVGVRLMRIKEKLREQMNNVLMR